MNAGGDRLLVPSRAFVQEIRQKYDTWEPIEIRLERDEMMIISYPGPDRSVRLDQLQAGRAQPRRYRNRRIGEFLKELEFTEGRCTGIPKIIEAMAKNGSPPAEFEFDEDHSYFLVRLTIQRRIAKPDVMRLIADADARFQLTQRERITLGILAQTEGMTARALGTLLETNGTEELAVWLGRLSSLSLVQSTGRTQGTRYFVDPELLRGADLKVPTTLLRIEPHRLQELVREDLRRYPRSKIGEISSRIGQEVNRSQLKRALAELVGLSVVVMEGERSGARYRLAGEK